MLLKITEFKMIELFFFFFVHTEGDACEQEQGRCGFISNQLSMS